jgi:deoxyguanosine kinase
MNSQHQVILSIGSNQGNRLQNIQFAIAAIHQEVGTIVKISRLYETSAWGFESDTFYNCALVLNSNKEAEDILNLVLAIEKKLGRVRLNSQGYQSRIIDIDLISYNEEIMQVPHPFMQDRMFVLLPMRDLNLHWRHPILQKYLPELLKASEDKSHCKLIQNLEFPLQKIKLNQFNYIAIEGNIGAGKQH